MFNGPNTQELQNPFVHVASFVSEFNKMWKVWAHREHLSR